MKKFGCKFGKGDCGASQRHRSSMFRLTLMTLGAGVLLASCQGGETSGNGEGLKLGTLAPTTGDLSSIGQNWPQQFS